MSAPQAVRTKVLARTGGICHYCPDEATTLDHIVPKCVGGPSRQWNLVGACGPCNRFKGNLRGVCICFDCIAAERMFAGMTPPAKTPKRRAATVVAPKTLARLRQDREYAASVKCPIARDGHHVRAYNGMGDFCVHCSEILPLSA